MAGHEYIDVTPTWSDILPLLLIILKEGTDEGKQTAAKELSRMAKLADLYNAIQELRNE